MAPPAATKSTITSCCCLIGQGSPRTGWAGGGWRLGPVSLCGHAGSPLILGVGTLLAFSISSKQGCKGRGVHGIHQHANPFPQPLRTGGSGPHFASVTGSCVHDAFRGQSPEPFLIWRALRVRDRCREFKGTQQVSAETFLSLLARPSSGRRGINLPSKCMLGFSQNPLI